MPTIAIVPSIEPAGSILAFDLLIVEAARFVQSSAGGDPDVFRGRFRRILIG